MLSKIIIGLPRTLVDGFFCQNNFFMVESTGVRGPTLARLATVSVWQRAVNRQPRSRSNNSWSRSASLDGIIKFSENFEIFEILNKN